ncbi:hypothetical protein RUM43_013411 [Polyplax serrata]|uniref:DAGKc domain-containing protein n=1 Tax=Polyplax serrata TaxID=468196 RepID=A0AAN8PJ35_POLSC
MDGGKLGCDTLLEETFYIFSKKNILYRVKLSEKGLSLVKESNGQSKTETIRVDDIVGAHCTRSKTKLQQGGPCVCGPNSKRKDVKVVEDSGCEHDVRDVSAYLYVYAYVLKKQKVSSGEKREKMTVTLRFRSFDKPQENMREAQRWRTVIKCLIKKRPVPNSLIYQGEQEILASPTVSLDEVQRLLILLNPKAGPGRAKEMFQTKIAPILTEAEISYDLYITKHPNYARDFVRLKDVYQWNGIVAVGGNALNLNQP